MRRTQHREAVGLATVDQLAENESGFDGFADADIVRDQQPHYGQSESHQKRNELVGSRLKAKSRR